MDHGDGVETYSQRRFAEAGDGLWRILCSECGRFKCLFTALACREDHALRHADFEQAFVPSVLDDDAFMRLSPGLKLEYTAASEKVSS